MLRMQRLVPVRVGLVALATSFVVFNSIVTVRGGQPASDAVVLALLGLYSVAIVGDTARPSGVVRSASTSPRADDVQASLRKLAEEAARRKAGQRPAAPAMPSPSIAPAPIRAADAEDTDPAAQHRLRVPVARAAPVPAPGSEGV